MEKYNYSVVIGRFQPYHIGHHELILKALRNAEEVIIVIGTHNAPRTCKNPFTSIERMMFINQTWEDNPRLHFVYVEDRLYQENEWVLSVQNKVYQIANPGDRVCIVGADKDESTYYLKHFKMWDFIPHDGPTIKGLDATSVRKHLFDDAYNFQNMRDSLPAAVYDGINKWRDQKPEIYARLKDEYEYVRDEKEKTQVGPYPVQFLTTDAVVIYSGQILLVQRQGRLGKGLWALPGGFVDCNESFFDGCLRELREETRLKVPEKVLKGSFKEVRHFDAPGRSLRGRTLSIAHSFVLDNNYERPDVRVNPQGMPEVHAGSDAAKAWWFPLAEVYQMRDQIFEDHLDIIQYFTCRL